LSLRQLVTVLPTSSDAIEWVRESARVEAAAPVEEATALTGTTGVKPEGSLTFDLVQDTIKTMAIWVPATKRILQDAPQLQAYINSYLAYDLGRELYKQYDGS
jgi:HK97 family phage major capsid protein